VSTGRQRVDGGVRKYLDRSLAQRMEQRRWARRLGALGDGAHLERGVEFLRHPERVAIGANAIIKAGARICPTNPTASIAIGEWTTVGYHTHVFATSEIRIGANCLIAPFCYLVDANHGIARERLIREQPMSTEPIAIGDDVWIGTGVTVLAGVTIGDGAVVGAGSVVSSDVHPYAVMSGVPAVQVAERRSHTDGR